MEINPVPDSCSLFLQPVGCHWNNCKLDTLISSFWSHLINLKFWISKCSTKKHITLSSQWVRIKQGCTHPVIHQHTWQTAASCHKATFKGLGQPSAPRRKIQTKPADFSDIPVTVGVSKIWVWSCLPPPAHTAWSYTRQGGPSKGFFYFLLQSQPKLDLLFGEYKSPKQRAVGFPPAIIQPHWRQPT